MTAAAYARFSSDNQREESIDAQLRAIQKYAEANNINVVKTYVDYAISGSTDERGQFQQMFLDAKRKLFDCVIVHKLDRFSRDLRDTLNYEHELNNLGVDLVSVVEPTDDTASGFLMRGMKGVLNHFYLLNLAEEVRKGQLENAYKCLHTGGCPPYGFDVGADKKLVINEYEAVAVKLVFDMYVKGSGYRQIAEELNAKGYKSKRNGEFKHTSIREMIRNDKYIGYYTYNKRNTKNHNSHKFNDDSEIIRIKDGVPRIIPDTVWFKAQKRMEGNKRTPRNRQQVYLLSGLIKCALCGKLLVGHTTYNGAGYVNSSYRCPGRRAPEKCDMRQVGKDKIEDVVISEIKRVIFNKDSAQQIASALKSEIAKNKMSVQGELKSIRGQLNQLDKEITNIINAIKSGIDTPSMRKELKTLENRKAYLQSELIGINEIQRAKVPVFGNNKAIYKKIQNASGWFRYPTTKVNQGICQRNNILP